MGAAEPVPGKTTLTSQLPLAPWRVGGTAEADEVEEEEAFAAEEANDEDEEHDGDEEHDEQSAPVAKLARMPPDGPIDPPTPPPPPKHKKKKRRGRRGGRRHRNRSARETALRTYIDEIYDQKLAGISAVMIKSQAQQVSAADLSGLVTLAAHATIDALGKEFTAVASMLLDAALEVAKLLKNEGGTKDLFDFCQDYIAALPKAKNRAIHQGVHQIHAHPHTKIVSKAKKLAENAGKRIQRDQSGEVLDAWTNGLRRAGKDPSKYGGVGGADDKGSPFNNAAEGRLHISGLRLDPTYDLKIDRAKLTMKGTPGRAGDLNLPRRLEDINVARTFDFKEERKLIGQRHAAFGVGPSDNTATKGVDDTSKAVFASYVNGFALDPANTLGEDDAKQIAKDWERGMNSLWSSLRGKLLSDFDDHVGG